MSEEQPPTLECVSMVFCDMVYHCPDTNRFSFLGARNIIRVKSLPWRVPESWLCCSLTSGRGEYRLRVTLEEGDPEQAAPIKCDSLAFRHPNELKEVCIGLPEIPVMREGLHMIMLHANDEPIAALPLWVRGVDDRGERAPSGVERDDR
jgi:hypothetical protein